jgi:ligand-binding sensor domain-containing protein
MKPAGCSKIGTSITAMALIALLMSCSTANNNQKNISSIESPVESRAESSTVEDSEPELHAEVRSGEPGNSEIELNIITESPDPLDEVGQLWYSGYLEDARIRFLKDDVSLLSVGSRDSEWALWRGRLFTKKWKGSEIGLAGENISAVLADSDDIWAGTWTGGIARLSEPLDSSVTWDPGLPSLAVRTINRIARDNDTIWIVRYGSVERYNLRSGRWSVESGLPVSERLQDICFVDGKIYLATLGHGLWVYEDYHWRTISVPGLFITRIEPVDEGQILIGTMDRGVYIFQPGDNRWLRPPPGLLREANITSLTKSGGKIVGGTYGSGAFIWDLESSDVRILGEKNLGDPWILAVAVSENRYFFGTFGAGLVSLDIATETWDRIGLAEGFPSADVASLSIDNNSNIWAGTLGGGIIRISGGIYGD